VSNYTKQVNFTEKDDKPITDPAKVIKGSEFDDEFDAIAFAISTKADSANPTLTGTTNVISLSLSGVPVSATAVEINALANVGTNTGVGVGLGPVVTTDGTQTISNKTISGGSIDDTPIGATTANTGSFTDLDADSLVLGANDAVTSVGQYATGTFTPTLFSGATEQSAGTATGSYIAVGDMVTIFITLLNIDATGSTSTAAVTIKNLPFNCAVESGGFYVGSAYCANIVNPSGIDNGHFIPVINSNSSTDSMTLFATVNNLSKGIRHGRSGSTSK